MNVDATLPQDDQPDTHNQHDCHDIVEQDHQQCRFGRYAQHLKGKSRPEDKAARYANEPAQHHDEAREDHQKNIVPRGQHDAYSQTCPDEMGGGDQLGGDRSDKYRNSPDGLARPDHAITKRGA